MIAEWCKKEGEVIKAGDVMAKVETDKATVDCECRSPLDVLADDGVDALAACCSFSLPWPPSKN